MTTMTPLPLPLPARLVTPNMRDLVSHFWPRYLDLVRQDPDDVDAEGLFDDALGHSLSSDDQREVQLVIELRAEHEGITGRNPYTGRFWACVPTDPGPARADVIVPLLSAVVARRNPRVPSGGWSIHDMWSELARTGHRFRHCDVYVTVHERPAELELELRGQTYWYRRELPLCACGCGTATATTWAAGHDVRYLEELQRAVLGAELTRAGARAQLPLTGSAPVRLETALRHLLANGHEDLAAQLRTAVEPVLGETLQQRLAAKLAALTTEARVEGADATDLEVESSFRRRARQLERELCLRYAEWRGLQADDLEFEVAGGRVDVLDRSRRRRPRVVEAKMDSCLTSAAQAAGQAHSYLWRLRRIDYGVDGLQDAELAVLLPAPPTPDTRRYLAERGVTLVYLEGDTFVEVGA